MAQHGAMLREVLRLGAQALAVGVGVSLVLGLAAFIVASQVRTPATGDATEARAPAMSATPAPRT